MRKLKYMPYAQAHIAQEYDGTLVLVSYRTPCVWLSPTGWLGCTGTYSRTTIRHISAFCREFGTDYYTAKKSYLLHASINIHTGEMVSWETGEVLTA